jgi:hypothetical protein
MDLVDISEWADDEIRVIQISLDFLYAPFEVRVRKFVPAPRYLLEERWVDKEGKLKRWPVPPYGIFRMAEAAESIGRMFEREAGNYIRHLVEGGEGDESDLLWQTYLEAFRQAGQAAVRLPFPTLTHATAPMRCAWLTRPTYPSRCASRFFLPTHSVPG